MKHSIHALVALAAFTLASGAASADTFVNGSFEDGTTSGWTTGRGYRANTLNSTLTPADVLPGGSLYDASLPTASAVVNSGYVDPNLGAALGSTVYSGNYSFRAEDTTSGGYASAISQTVANYTDANIFFAWKAVLENGGHAEDESALLRITLRDDTTGTDVVTRTYNAGAGGGGVDARFSSQGGLFYTPQWQIEQIAIDASLAGHTFTLSLLAADCEPTGHTGYAYLDGFSNVVVPPGNVPEPASLSLLGLGLAGLAMARRKRG